MSIEKQYAVYVCDQCGRTHEMAVIPGNKSIQFSCLNCGHKIKY